MTILVLFIYLFKILRTIQSRTPYKSGAEVKRIHVYKIYLQKVSRNKINLNKSVFATQGLIWSADSNNYVIMLF